MIGSGRRERDGWAVWLGIGVAVVAIGVGVWRCWSMARPTSDSVAGMSGAHDMSPMPLHGMPLSAMPEMFVAGAAVMLVIVLTWRRRASAPSAAARAPATGHRVQAVVLTAALAVDVSKTSSLGFVIPGMRVEYGLTAPQASMLAVAGLSGTSAGAFAVRWAADRMARRDIYLLASLGFTVTSSCAFMPSFGANLVMCFLMGTTVGGLAPMLVAALRDNVLPGDRGGGVVASSVSASAVGFLIAAGTASWLEPDYGWRVLWLIGAPTGLVLLLLSPLLAEPWSRGLPAARAERMRPAIAAPLQYAYALLTGIVAFGVSTWTPTLVREDLPVNSANQALTLVAVALIPIALVIGFGYTRFGPVAVGGGVAVGTGGVLLLLLLSAHTSTPAWLGAAALVGTLFCVNTMSAVFLPMAANLSHTAGRTRKVATVSVFNRLGGLSGPLLVAAVVTSRQDVIAAIATMAGACIVLAAVLQHRSARDLAEQQRRS